MKFRGTSISFRLKLAYDAVKLGVIQSREHRDYFSLWIKVAKNCLFMDVRK
jgi:hypothetical protein